MGAFPFTKRFDGNEIIYLESMNIDTITVDYVYFFNTTFLNNKLCKRSYVQGWIAVAHNSV